MRGACQSAWEEGPAGPDELVLAEFIDTALERLVRGETVDTRQLLVQTPALMERGRRLLADAHCLLWAAAALRDHSQWLRSDLVSQSTVDRTAEPASESTLPPDPFPEEFRVLHRLGGGAFGTVWLAEDLHLGRRVALKTIRLPGPSETSGRLLERLREEARLLASVRHRNITQVYAWRDAVGSAGRDHYLVLEFVPGGSLADRVHQEGPLPWRLASRYIGDVAEALIEVHACGIIHRDVKPANILWNSQVDEAVLTDFGISARLADPDSVAGTPFYMPPEAFRGTVGFAQDVYGLAASMFWLLTGSLPYPGPDVDSLIAQAKEGLPEPEPRCAIVPAPIERLLRAGLAADPRQRPVLRDFVTTLRGELNQLLADSLLLVPSRRAQAPVRLHLTVSRQAGRHTFLPLVSTQPPVERFVRDMRRVPPAPGRVEAYTGDRLRIEVESDRSGYVTVWNIGPTGNLNLLFPATPAGSVEPVSVAAGVPVQIADVQLAAPAGRERLFALWTRTPLSLPLGELLSLTEPAKKGGSRPYRATRDLVKVQQTVESLGPEDWHTTLLELNHFSGPENRHEQE
jgi:serine/threonine protein kinase